VFTDARLGHMVNIAFGVRNMQWIRSSPDWVTAGDERFNLEGKAEDPANTTEEQLLAMLRTLLVERFQMKYHREPVEMSGYALLVGKNGPKLKLSTSDKETMKFETVVEGKAVGVGKPMPGRPITFIGQQQSLAALADLLTFVGQMGPFADRTGLPGVYDFRLSWDESDGPPLAAALQDQLGLRLEKQKVTVSYLVIDSAKRPTGN
jgi:uncharacterized protein (TIGR03435 family)